MNISVFRPLAQCLFEVNGLTEIAKTSFKQHSHYFNVHTCHESGLNPVDLGGLIHFCVNATFYE